MKTRRAFLKTVAAGAGAVGIAGVAGATAGASSDLFAEPSSAAQGSIEYPRVFRGMKRKMIAFPLGGIGAGSISLGGRGQLHEWWIANRPDKGKSPDYAFPAIWLQSGNLKPVARVLEARILPPFEGPSGLGSANVPGLPRLATSAFTGEFPLARVDFEDRDLPVGVTLEAFTPFIPLDADDSGLPVAILRYRVSNPGPANATVSIAFSIDNPVSEGAGNAPAGGVGSHGRTNEYRESDGIQGLLMRNPFLPASDAMSGTFVLAALGARTGKLSYLRGWPSARWWQSPLLFWEDFSKDGEVGPEAAVRTAVGSLCLQRAIPAKDEAEYTFLLSWYFPNRTPARCGWAAPKGHENDVIGNYYSTRFKDAWQAAEYAVERLPQLEKRTRQFAAAVRETTAPGAVKDAATATLAALVASTCFRTSDGAFHGFEGSNPHSGCCFGSCTHVWNYESATASLFPRLSRSLREQQFGFLTDKQGLMDFRELLPYGIERWGFAAADGQMGTIMKLYDDWRLSGDTAWLKTLWPTAKRALEFAWIPGGWDANRDGVMEGVQSNTYDVEFIGPNPLCGIWYLGALKAAEEMARTVGDPQTAETCHRLLDEGSSWIDAHLFNGEFYIQKIGAVPANEVAKGLRVGMGTTDTEHPTFQLGDGCLSDQLVGQYYARMAGIGNLLESDHIHKTLRSIYKYNYKRTLADHVSVQRTYALNNEAGLVICTYPRGVRPQTPFPYFAEVWSGVEYAVAALMLHMGMTTEGFEIVESARSRYDGEKRNPWDEAECGYYYVRPMAGWAPFLALSGFTYRGAEKKVTVKPQTQPEHFQSFWSTASGWGTFTQRIQQGKVRLSLYVIAGRLECQSVSLASRGEVGAKSTARLGARSLPHALTRQGGDTVFEFPETVMIEEGSRLTLSA